MSEIYDYDRPQWGDMSYDEAERYADRDYCDYCESDGHTFRSCPKRDDEAADEG